MNSKRLIPSIFFIGLLWFVLFPLSSCSQSVANRLKFQSESVLYNEKNTNLLLREYVTDELIRLPVWEVLIIENGKKQVLFTVQRVWQEEVPGVPAFQKIGNELTISDRQGSYIFSIQKRNFLKNMHPESVYQGPFRM